MNIDLKSYLDILYRRWWALMGGLVAGLGVSYLAFSLLGALPVYSATATTLVTDTGSAASLDRYGTLVLTCAELARQDTVTQAVVDALKLPISAREVAEATQVSIIAETWLMEISVTHRDPLVAAAVANELARQLSNHAWVREYRLQVVSAAVPPDLPDPGPYINVLLGGGLGVFLLAGLVLFREYLAGTFQSAALAAWRLDLPVLGTLARHTDKQAQAIWPLVELCSRLGKAGHRRVLITSPGLGEGKSTLAVLLAQAWARTGRTAILVDAHVQQPVLRERLGCAHNHNAGLTDWLASPKETIPTYSLSECLALLPSGVFAGDPAAVLASQQWPALLTILDRQADIVVIDGPPVLPAAEIALLAPLMDGILLVARVGKTKYSAAGEALEALRMVDGPVLGLVLN